MKQWIKTNPVLLALLAIGLAAAVVILAGRASVEAEGKSYDIVLDYADLEKLVQQSEEDADFWLRHLRSLGIDKCALQEVSIKSLADRADGTVYLINAADLKADFGWDRIYPAAVARWAMGSDTKNDALAVVTDPELFSLVLHGLETRADGLDYKTWQEEGVGYVWLHGEGVTDGKTWATMPLGIDSRVAEMITNAGYTLVPRTVTVKGTNTARFGDAVEAEFLSYHSPYFIDGSVSIPGYEGNPEAVAKLINYLEKSGSSYVLLERSNQSLNLEVKGMDDLVPASGYNAVRAFTMWSYIQNSWAKYNYTGPEEISNALYRAIYERSCRVIYFKMILDSDSTTEYITDPEAYSKLLGDLNARMASLGYRHETVKPFREYKPSVLLRFLVGVGAIAAAVLCLEMIIPMDRRVKYILTLLGVFGVAGAFIVAPNTSKLVLSIGAGIALPSLAAVGLCRWLEKEPEGEPKLKSILPAALGFTLAAAAISLVGAFMSASALSETSFMLEMELYRGVKFMQLMPLVVFVIAFLLIFLWEKRFGRLLGGDKEARNRELMKLRAQVSDTLDTTVKIRDVVILGGILLLLAILAVIGVYYLDRTGNSENVPTLELIFRNFLEGAFAARPRTKEFLIGWPCAMLFVWSLRRRVPVLPFVFGAGAVIGGFVSPVNTFLHIRTGVLISLIRVLTGLGLGLILGALAVVIAEALLGIRLRRKARRENG